MNGTMKTFILMAAITALFGWVGSAIGGYNGMMFALIIAGGMNFWSYFNSDKAVLRHYNAHEVPATHDLYQMVSELCVRANLPMPKVCIIDNAQPNAFATGRNPEHAAVVASTGLLQKLSYDEIRGVMAHELAHIKNRDTLTMTFTASIAGAISMLGNFLMFAGSGSDSEGRARNPLISLLIMLLAPLAASIVQMAISRAREFEADRVGAEISGAPRALAAALANISGNAALITNTKAEQNPASAHMFIINPLHFGGMTGLFSTHPRTEDRIEKLLAMDESSPHNAAHVPPSMTNMGASHTDDVFGNPHDMFGDPKGDDNPWK
jgi:heat shock protein HtpX